MKRYLAIIALIVLCSFLVVQVGAAKLVIIYPAQYEELRTNLGSYSILWTCTDTNVDHYLVAVRKYTKDQRQSLTSEGAKIVNNKNNGTSTYYTISSSYIESDCLYKIKICVVRTDGTRTWSDDAYFYTSFHNGIVDDGPLSFKIWSGFTDLTKSQIYYAAQTWRNAIGGVEYINTYPFSESPWFNLFPLENGTNAITKMGYSDPDEYLMVTKIYPTSSREITEADINVNPAKPWANSAQPGHIDVQSIITHEMGHVLGLTDKYRTKEPWVFPSYPLLTGVWTMYGYKIENSIEQRTPEQNDINGVNNIY